MQYTMWTQSAQRVLELCGPGGPLRIVHAPDPATPPPAAHAKIRIDFGQAQQRQRRAKNGDSSRPRGRVIMTSSMVESTSQVWTVGRLLNWTRDWFTQNGVDQPRLSAELLLAHALQCKRIELYTQFELVPTPEQIGEFRLLVRQAGDHSPIAYLIGTKEFYALAFEVSEAVLIPRPETETLVQHAVEHLRSLGDGPRRFWDVGTGSGCIAVAMCRQLRDVTTLATDASAEALEIAARNVKRHGLDDRITLVQADGLSLPADGPAADPFDLMVSNPPYIADGELEQLDENVRRYEPHLALSAGADGLRFYRLFAEQAAEHLVSGGSLIVEVGHQQAGAVAAVMTAGGAFRHAATWRDQTCGHERVMHFVANPA